MFIVKTVRARRFCKAPDVGYPEPAQRRRIGYLEEAACVTWARRAGLTDMTIAVVTGDDVTPIVSNGRHRSLELGEPFDSGSVVSANASIVERGADVVITGRVADHRVRPVPCVSARFPVGAHAGILRATGRRRHRQPLHQVRSGNSGMIIFGPRNPRNFSGSRLL